MLLDFFPSRTLTWYLGKTFMVRAGAFAYEVMTGSVALMSVLLGGLMPLGKRTGG